MPTHVHPVVWPTRHLHHKANAIGGGHAKPDTHFLEEVANTLGDAGEILIIEPAGAKTELAKYPRGTHPAVSNRIVAVEATDYPTDRQIVAAKRHFKMGRQRIAHPTTA